MKIPEVDLPDGAKITAVTVRFSLPEKWGNPTARVDADGNTLRYLVWESFSYFVRCRHNFKDADLADVEDQTMQLYVNGHDESGLVVRITGFRDNDQLNRTIAWCEQMMAHAYGTISDYKCRKAKRKT